MARGGSLPSFRRSHTIDGSAAGAQTDYQVRVKVLYGGEGSVLDHYSHVGHYDGPPANPIIPEGAALSADAGIREIGNVLYEPGDALRPYKTFYSGSTGVGNNAGICYAYSLDGVNWTKLPANPVIGPGTGYEDPYVVNVGGTYYLFCEDNAPDNIVMYHSADCEVWIADGVVIPRGGAGSWDERLTGSPAVWVEDGTWYMLYEGMDAALEGNIGLATSPDGAVWTKYGLNPVMEPSATGWDSYEVISDDIVKVDETYYLFYHGTDSDQIIYKSGMAHSTDLHNWTKHSENPLVYPQAPLDIVADNVLWDRIHQIIYWNSEDNIWVSHYCSSRRFNDWSGGRTTGICRGEPRWSGYQLVSLGGKCRTDFGDIRFTQDGTELDYWLEEKIDGEYALFWVEVPTIPVAGTTIYVYYGKEGASTTSSGDDTFPFFDDFEDEAVDDPPDAAKWTTAGTDGADWIQVKLDPVDATNKVLGIHESGDNVLTRPTTIDFGDQGGIAFGAKYYRSGNKVTLNNYMAIGALDIGSNWIFNGYTHFNPEGRQYYHDGINPVDYTPAVTGNDRLLATKWYVLEYRLHSASMKLIVDENPYTGGYTLPYATIRYLIPQVFQKLETNRTRYLDNVYVRKLVDPEPTHGAWGAARRTRWPF